jgi:hypothetical protein
MSNSYRLNSKSIFITIPQCDMSKAEAHKIWEDKLRLKGIVDFIVCQEVHEDGNTHLHAAYFLENKVNYKDPHCLDIQAFHGSYEGVKNKIATIRYLLKEDPEPLTSRDWTDWLERNAKHAKQEKNVDFLNQLKEKGPRQLLEEGNVSAMNYLKIKQTYETIMKEDEEKKQAENKEDLPSSLDNPWNLKLQVNTDLKKCHLWLYSSSPNLGKTTWAIELCNKFRAEFWNYLEIYQPQITKAMEIIILDEFRGQLKVTQLNSICDGNYWFTGKNMNPWKLNQKPLVIILANRSPNQVYKNLEDVALISARFTAICLDKFKRDEQLEEEKNENE